MKQIKLKTKVFEFVINWRSNLHIFIASFFIPGGITILSSDYIGLILNIISKDDNYDYQLPIGITIILIGVLLAIFGYFKKKQVPHDEKICLVINSLLNQNQFINILDTFKNNAHILKKNKTEMELYFTELKKQRFKSPIIRYRVKKLLKSFSDYDRFIYNKIFDIKGQISIYHHFLPDQNIDLSNPSTESQVDFDTKFNELTDYLNKFKKKYKKFIKSCVKRI